MITLLGGEGGTLKSTITSAIATPISLGGEWPHGEGRAPLGRTLIISAEDDPASVIVPRLVANGADRSKIEIIGGILRKSTEVKGAFSIQPEHLAALDSFIRRLGDVRLVIIDPIASYIGSGVDTYKNSEVRSVLDPFAAMAARMGFAVIAITHTAKGKVAGKARFIDSVAFVNVARVAYFADENPAVRGGRMLTLQKNNIIPDGVPILTYHGENVETPNNDGELFSAARIVWDAPGNAGEAMQPPITNTRPRTHDKAIALIQEALKDGCRPMKEVMLLGVDQGISGRAMARAKDSLGVTSLHQTRHWEWCPPNT
jgi:putative DNA primase/helicase